MFFFVLKLQCIPGYLENHPYGSYCFTYKRILGVELSLPIHCLDQSVQSVIVEALWGLCF
jgi:hypothetical protein